MERILSVRGLQVWFPVRTGFLAGLARGERKFVRAVDGIDFEVLPGEVFCLVGESGCGKTTTGKAVLRLNEPTGGSLLFAMSEQEWNRVNAIQQRLQELEPALSRLTEEEKAKARQDFEQLSSLKRRIEHIRSPAASTRLEGRIESLERSIEVLETRAKALREGKDPTVTRLVSKSQRRLELLKAYGSRVHPRHARRRDAVEKELKEARYRLRRAEIANVRAGKWKRTVRSLERRLERFSRRVNPDDPAGRSKASELANQIDVRRRELTGAELAQVEAELDELGKKRDAYRSARGGADEASQEEFRRLEKEIADLQSRGSPGLEAREVRAEWEELRRKYDLVAWGEKRRFRGRLKARRQLKRQMQSLRKRVQIIYQDPYESLNPKMSIFDIVAEPLLANRIVDTPSEAEAVVAKSLEDVGLRPANEFMFRYPHELSGGQRQRVGIATALVVDPDFIVADEPVSMLDASVRTEILALLLDLKKRRDLTYLFITHDLGLAWILADRIAVMYLGKIVETGDGAEIIQNPRHPYTKALISVVPSPNPSVYRQKIILRGERPNPVDIPPGCRFHPRCPMAVGICGWNSQEVRQELLKLCEEDRGEYPEARSVTDITAYAPFALKVTASDPAAVEKYLKKRVQAIALGRPALGAIHKMQPSSGSLVLTLHRPVEPPLRVIKGNISVACHLVEPEIAEAEAVVAE